MSPSFVKQDLLMWDLHNNVHELPNYRILAHRWEASPSQDSQENFPKNHGWNL